MPRNSLTPLPLLAGLTAALLLTACAGAPANSRLLAQADVPDTPSTPVNPDDPQAQKKANPLSGAPPEIVEEKPLDLGQRNAAEIHILAGEMAAARNQPGQAAQYFLLALESVKDPELAQRATAMALTAGDRPLSIKAAKAWLKLQPNEMDPREVIARISVEDGDKSEALKQCEAIVNGHAGGVADGLAYSARLLAQASTKASDTALAVMNELAKKYPKEVSAQQALAIVALRFGRMDAAESAARKARELAPKSKESGVLLAGVLVRKGQLEEADKIFESVASAEKDSAELRLGYAKVLLEAGHRGAARTQTRKALAAKPGYADALYALGVMAFNDHDLDEAENSFKLAMQGERAKDAAYQLGLLAEERKQYDEAMKYFEQVTAGPLALDAAIRRGHVLAQTKKVPQARALMQRLRDQLPQAAERLYVAEAAILSDADAVADAQSVYVDAMKEFPDSAELLYSRSLLHEKQKRIDLAEADLRAMLKQDADDSRALNALGYMLTVHTDRYKEARKLIERAYELEPEDPAIMDSLGWVQYKMGKPKEAREMLQKAYDKMQDPEVAAHLGEVLWALGEKDQARAIWDKALKNDPSHVVLNDTVKRFIQ